MITIFVKLSKIADSVIPAVQRTSLVGNKCEHFGQSTILASYLRYIGSSCIFHENLSGQMKQHWTRLENSRGMENWTRLDFDSSVLIEQTLLDVTYGCSPLNIVFLTNCVLTVQIIVNWTIFHLVSDWSTRKRENCDGDNWKIVTEVETKLLWCGGALRHFPLS